MSSFNLKAIFSLVDRMTAPAKKVADSMKGIEQATAKVGQAGKITERITEAMSRTFNKAKDIATNLAGRVVKAKTALDEYSGAAKKAEKSTGLLHGAVGKLAGVFAGLSAVAVVKGFIDTGAKFETYQATLKTVLGSQAKAKEAMAWVQNFAMTTPYEVDEVTAAFVKLNAYGIDPTNGTLRTLGDAAAGMGKTLDQAVEALADAQTFQFERLKEFGITASVQSNKVFLSFSKNGKNYAIEATKSASAIRKALTKIFDRNFAGAMEEQAGTMKGIVSNLHDYWTKFQLAVDNAGLFSGVKARLNGLLIQMNLMSQNGQLQAWAKKFSDALTNLFNSLWQLATSIDWVALINGIAKFVTWVTKLVNMVGGLKNLVDIGIAAWIASWVFGLNALTPAIIAVAAALFGLELAAWPVTLTIAAIAALAGIAFLVWRNWDFLWKHFKTFIAWLAKTFRFAPIIGPLIELADMVVNHWDKVTDWFHKAGDFLTKWFVEKPRQWWNSMPEWFRNLLTGALTMSLPGGPLLATVPALMQSVPSALGGRQNFKGEIDVRVHGPASVHSVKSNGDAIDLSTYTGYQGAF